MNRFFFLLVICGLSIFCINNAFATASISLSPTSGIPGTTVTVSGSGWTASTINSTNNFQASSDRGWNGAVNVGKFTGLNPGKTITSFSLLLTSLGTGTFVQTNGYQSAHTIGWNGGVNVEKFTALPAGSHISKFGLKMVTAAGNVRAKIYDDSNGGLPGNLLGESASIAAVGAPLQNFTLDAVIPSDGVVWAGFETDSGSLDLDWSPSAGIGLRQFVSHVYGPGPNPFGTATSNDSPAWSQITYSVSTTGVRVKVYKDDGPSGNPSTLLGESNSLKVPKTGITDFPVLATIPASGNVWAGFETNNTLMTLADSNGQTSGTRKSVTHTYGPGPNPFGTVIDSTVPMWSRISYGNITISMKMDGNPLSTTPPTVAANSTGGFSGVTFSVPNLPNGVHTVNATDLISFAIATFNITPPSSGSGSPYVTDLHYTTLAPTTATLAWSTPNLSGFVFHGYQIRYNTPFGTPNTILVNNTNSSVTSFKIFFLTPGTQYSFQIGTWANSTNYHTFSNILNFTTITNAPPNLGVGNLNLNVGTNPTHVGYQFFRQNTNATKIDLFVSYPTTYNTTCNLNYEFANTNKNYSNLSTTSNGTGRVKADFQFFNLGNEVVNTICRDVITNDTGHYTLTNTISAIPLVQQVQNFENGKYGTQGQFGAFDLIELMVLIISMIALNRVNETVGTIIMIFVIGGLAFFHIGSFPVIIFSGLAMIILLAVSTTKRLAFTP